MLGEDRGRPTFRSSLPLGGLRLTADSLTDLDEMFALPPQRAETPLPLSEGREMPAK